MECQGSCSSLMTRIEAMSERSGLSQLFSECWEILTSKLTPTNTVAPIAALLLVLIAEHACAFAHSDTDSPDRFFAVEEWEASIKVDLHQDTELPYPPPLVTRYHKRGKSQGRARISRISATDHAVIWDGPGEASCSYVHSSLAVRPAFTVSSLTKGQSNLPAEVSLRIYPESGEYNVSLRVDGLLPVVERSWTERHPEIDRVASMVQSANDPLEVLAGLPMLLAQALIPESTVQEREVSPAVGSSQRLKLPATGMVLSGRHQDGAITLNWSLRPAHEEKMRIYRIDDGLWEDVTDTSSDVLSGQRVELEGRSIRMSEVIGFEWELEGLDEGKAIDDWRVEGNMPQIIPIADTQSSKLDFAYWDGHENGQSRRVVFKAILQNGEELKAETELLVYKPTTTLDLTMGQVGLWEVRVDGRRAQAELGLLDPATGKGMVFEGSVSIPPQFADVTYQMQYVQLVATDAYRLRLGTRMAWERATSEGDYLLDGFYPYPSERQNNRQYTDDSPAAPLTQTAALQSVAGFQTSFMYRPEGTRSIWVPLKQVDWGWRGYATYKSGGHPGLSTRFDDFVLVRSETVTPRVLDAPGYLHWTRVKRPGSDIWRPVLAQGVARADDWHPPPWGD